MKGQRSYIGKMSVSGVGLFAKKEASHGNEEQLKLENEALEKEFAWLLETEYRCKLSAMDKCMEECSKKFSLVFNPSGVSGGDVRPILLSSPQQGDSVFCVAHVDGDKVAKAEITLKLPGRKPLRTYIKEHAAWTLRQIQDSANFFQLAQEKYAAIQLGKEDLRLPGQIQRTFSDLAACLRQAEEVLVLPLLPTVQEIYTAEQRSHLKPELPEDMALHLHISSAMLVLTVLTVSQSPKPGPAHQGLQGSGAKTDEGDTTSWIGVTFEYGATTYEVSNQIQVRSQVPWLANVLRLLQETLELAQDLIDKVKVFEAMSLAKRS